MREIKFKAKRSDNKEWIYGVFIQLTCETQGGDNPKSELLSFVVPIGQNEEDTYIEVDPETVCQFTGLKDKNGVDVYTSDLVLSNTLDGTLWDEPCSIFVIGEVYGTTCFLNLDFRPVRQWKDGIHDWCSIENVETFDIEITGNIHN